MNAQEYDNAIAVTRKLAREKGRDAEQVGCAYLAAGIAKALGAEITAKVTGLNSKKMAHALGHIPSADSEELEALPAVIPDDDLKKLLCHDLKGFRDGSLDSSSTLQRLLESKKVRHEFLRLLRLPVVESTQDVQDLVRQLSKLFHQGYLIGSVRYGLENKNHAPEYIAGSSDDEFQKAVENFNNRKLKVSTDVYGATSVRSYFRGLLRNYGPLGADTFLAVLVNEFTPYSQYCERGISIRELTWTIAPDAYLRLSGRVAKEVGRLVKEFGVLKYVNSEFYTVPALSSRVILVEDEIGRFSSVLNQVEDGALGSALY